MSKELKEKELTKGEVNENNEKCYEHSIKKCEKRVLSERIINDIEKLMRSIYPTLRKELKLVQRKELDNEFLADIRNALKKHISPESEDISTVIYEVIKLLLKNYGFKWEVKFIVNKE
jgi:hypothetical protein